MGKTGEIVSAKPVIKKQKGTDDLFEDAYKTFSPRLKKFLLNWLKFVAPDKAERLSFFIEDALQETFCSFCKKSGEISEKHDKPMAWLRDSCGDLGRKIGPACKKTGLSLKEVEPVILDLINECFQVMKTDIEKESQK